MLNEQEYKDYCRRFAIAENYLKQYSAPVDLVAKEICSLRGYYPERMIDILKKAGFMYIEEGKCDFDKMKSLGNDLALFSNKGNFLLEGRFIFPVRDMLGNTVALIGWFPDEKKYVTTPSKMFSKSCLFYGMEQLSKTGIGKKYILVEGIFDCLSVRSLGIPCIAQMGITASRYKVVLYSMFSSLVGIPDNDFEGRGVISKDSWMLPSNSRYFRWTGDNSKDIDTLCNNYEAEDVKELLLSIFNDKRRVVTFRV